MVKQQRMTITQAEQGKHESHGAVTKVHLEPVASGAGSKRGMEVLVIEALLVGHDKVTVGEVIQVNFVEALQ